MQPLPTASSLARKAATPAGPHPGLSPLGPSPAHLLAALTLVTKELGEQCAGGGDDSRGVVWQAAEHVHDEPDLLPFFDAQPFGVGNKVKVSGQVHVAEDLSPGENTEPPASSRYTPIPT